MCVCAVGVYVSTLVHIAKVDMAIGVGMAVGGVCVCVPVCVLVVPEDSERMLRFNMSANPVWKIGTNGS